LVGLGRDEWQNASDEIHAPESPLNAIVDTIA
jgi:hypothetical protein